MASVGINPPKTPVTKGSSGVAPATVPNVCKMPGPPAPFVPTPLPNIGKSGDSPKGYSKKVKIEGSPVAIKGATFKSMGDVASKGTGGGLVSANTHGVTKFVGPGSFDTKIEGKNVQLLSDPMLNNCGGRGSPPNSATLGGEIQMVSIPGVSNPEKCPTCKTASGATKSDAEDYEDFFDESEKADLDAIAAEHPDLVALLPPKDAKYRLLSPKDNKASYKRFEAKKKKAKMKGEYHHPHPRALGGCPIHQVLVQKPDEEPGKSEVDAVDKKINDVMVRAIERRR